jgi:hypothetical protein
VISAQFWGLQKVVGDAAPNDGIVTVASAKWGLFRGCVRADHAGLVGQPARRGANAAGFDHLAFYKALARHLAERGL